MSKLKALLGKSEIHKIGEIEIEFQPFRLDELELFSFEETSSNEEKMKKSMDMVKYVLRKSVPEATDEELNGISSRYLGDIMTAIMKVNHMENKVKIGIPHVVG